MKKSGTELDRKRLVLAREFIRGLVNEEWKLVRGGESNLSKACNTEKPTICGLSKAVCP
jgi:hypothetical protein